VQFKLAILTILATRPDGRATLDELKGEVEARTADVGDHEANISSALEDIDIFQSGLVIPEGSWLQITAAGRAALKAIEGQANASLELPRTSTSHSLRLIDDLIGTEQRLKIFDLELRDEGVEPGPEETEIEDASSMHPAPAARETNADLPPATIAQSTLGEAGDTERQEGEPVSGAAEERLPTDTPTFLVRDAHGSRVHGQEPPRRSRFSRLIADKPQQVAAIWRRHLEQDTPNVKAAPRRGNVGGAAIALLSFLVLVICAGAVIALTQIRSLKSEVATLQRELSPLRERAAKADLLEKTKQIADQQKEAQNKSAAEKNKAGSDPRAGQAALNLTPDEIRLIRDYIKPAPSSGTPAPAINIGDTVGVATIPLPSQLMEKIPQLLGARFTTRNGSIVILRRDSRQADIVLPPN
jgi:hypothetical protein